MIVLSAKLSKADGQVSREELIAVKDKLKIPESELDQVGKIFNSDKQISPLSGSIKKQTVSLIGTKNITINGKEYLTEHFNIKSNDEDLSDEKKFEFDVWYNPENNLILKVTYNKMGNWEYRLRSFE